jgi:hypothetical protein
MDEQEQQEVTRIAREYFLQELGSEERADDALAKLASLVQEDGSKLVHIGDVLFLVLVRGEGVVEVHTIGVEVNPRELAQNFVDLASYLQNIGVKVAYTYSEDNRFARLARMTGLPVKQTKAVIEGKSVNVYIMEF